MATVTESKPTDDLDSGAGSEAARAVLAYARAQHAAIRASDPAVRRGDEDAVHDMRVAIRRLRSTLRTFRGMWDRGRSEALRSELKWLADQLGSVRDGQVMARRLADAVHAEPVELVIGPVAARLHQQLTADTAKAHAALREILEGQRYARTLGDVAALVDTATAGSVSARWVRTRVRRSVRRADRLLDRAGRDSGGADRDVRLHEARKAYKRARYAVEVVKPLAGKPARRFAKLLAELQDVLGAHQDAVITAQVLRRQGLRAYHDGENAFTYGLLHGRQQAAGQAVLADLPAAARRARRSKVRSWLAKISR